MDPGFSFSVNFTSVGLGYQIIMQLTKRLNHQKSLDVLVPVRYDKIHNYNSFLAG
jgi:hypothetical protein